MAAVKKVGFAKDIIPTREEINEIHSFIKGILEGRIPVRNRHTKEKKKAKFSVLSFKDIGDKPLYIKIKDHNYDLDIPEVNYITHSEYLSNKKKNIYRSVDGYSFFSIFNLWGSNFINRDEMVEKINRVVNLSEDEPVKLTLLGTNNDWIYKGFHYTTDGLYTDEEFKLLIFEEFDKERRKFERLKKKFSTTDAIESSKSRPRIPERIRIQVWRRDGGKCVRCGSRENLEYDHIIPISKGGSNTTRNIELLCQNCNRTKGNKIE